ncbi:PREDICTED: mucin-5AC [Drosophila arizonae]|uniref:Mucin-5AC n=1 Tax=Drosophila arizonae TaxID=7263 RepID=A0ABM1NYW8_DROAR|nr:PREDICTED: mucin-5AC [Drosophila arizonae]
MHTDGHEESTELRLSLDLGISNQQPAEGIEVATNLQMPGKYCPKNNQQHRGRRRRSGAESAKWKAAGGFSGIFCWSINMAILIWLAHCTNAVPTDSISSSSSHSASSTIVMAAVTPSSISSSGSSTTESLLEQQQPQGQCLLDGIWVPETTVHCEKQTSCRAIQRTGHCCPDYKCDCQKDGKTYANGYKLVDPDTPCTVCYCKGGEIVCSPVTCFRRDDCMPKYVPGRCCPEYDNCPILDNNPPLSSESSSAAPSTAKPAPAAPPAGFNWNITIKEITKPTEIRITDDNHKVKQTIPTRKASNTEAPTAATSAATTTTTTTTAAAATPPAAAAVADGPTAATDIPASEATTPPAAAVASTTAAAMPTAAATDSPATPTPSQDTNPKALPVNGSESLKLIASVGYIERPLSHNKPLVTYNSDSLQPLAENDPSKVNIKREYTTEGVAGLLGSKAEAVPIGASSIFLQNGFRDALVENAAELEPDTAGGGGIYHIISTTEGPTGSSTSRGGSSSNNPSSTERTSISSTEGGVQSTDYSSTYISNVTFEQGGGTEGLMAISSSSELPASSRGGPVHHMEEEDVPQVESNPAGGALPEDDFSLRDVNFPLVEGGGIVEAETKDEQRSIVSPFELDNKRTKLVTESSLDASGNGSGAGSGGGSGDSEFYLGSTTGGGLSAATNLEKATILQVPLMYSAEDSSAETRIQNVNELAKISARQTENETSGELDTGSGQGELREPTTPRAQRLPAVDIDELGSGSGSGAGQAQGAQDPKADAESLKLNESHEQADNVVETKATSRAEKSFVEQRAAGAVHHLERLFLQRIY